MTEQCGFCKLDMKLERTDQEGDKYFRCPKCKRAAVKSAQALNPGNWTGLWGIPVMDDDGA